MFSNLDRTPVVKNILIINIVIFLLMNFTSLERFYDLTSLHYFDTPSFRFWQVFTHMFQHARLGESIGIMHIIFNMFVLYQFGSVLEKYWGSKNFLFFYLFAGFGSALFFVLNQASIFKYAFDTFYPVSEGLLNPAYISAAVGASGAISGIVAAFAFLHPNTELMLMFIPVPIKAKYLVSAFFAYDLFAGISSSLKQVGIIDSSAIGGDGVAHFAHIGGAIFGLLLVIYWQKNRNSFY